jgi:methyl-accepting chemotaxis protein
MAYATKGPTLSHEELAALDLVIMTAVQRGAQPNEVLGFIGSIVHAVSDAAHSVTNAANQAAQAAQQATDAVQQAGQQAAQSVTDATQAAQQQAELLANLAQEFHIFGAAATRVEGPAATAIKQVVGSMAKAPSLTLQQLIDIRRNAVNAQSGK